MHGHKKQDPKDTAFAITFDAYEECGATTGIMKRKIVCRFFYLFLKIFLKARFICDCSQSLNRSYYFMQGIKLFIKLKCILFRLIATIGVKCKVFKWIAVVKMLQI